MEARKHPNDDGVIHIQRLQPGQVDIVLGSYPRRKSVAHRGKSRPWGWMFACLTFAGLAYWLGASLLVKPAPAIVAASLPPLDTASPTPVSPQTHEPQPMPDQTAHPALRPAAYVVPQPVAQEQPASVQPLDNCIKDGNVIDESVLNCRFGQVPRPARTEPTAGMVSTTYMADFKADAARKEAPRSKPYTVVSMSIREWDGSDRYRAQWRVYDNRIDQDSVCENFLARSVERRECRKSAQGHFKELCREWGKRAARDRNEESEKTEQRYCEVAGTFSP